jgi:hypothetical protein
VVGWEVEHWEPRGSCDWQQGWLLLCGQWLTVGPRCRHHAPVQSLSCTITGCHHFSLQGRGGGEPRVDCYSWPQCHCWGAQSQQCLLPTAHVVALVPSPRPSDPPQPSPIPPILLLHVCHIDADLEHGPRVMSAVLLPDLPACLSVLFPLHVVTLWCVWHWAVGLTPAATASASTRARA